MYLEGYTMGFGMKIRQNQKNIRKNPTFNSLLAPKGMAQIEFSLFYPHIAFGSLGSACPVMAGRGEEQIPAYLHWDWVSRKGGPSSSHIQGGSRAAGRG